MSKISKQTLYAIPSVIALVARVGAVVILALQNNYAYNAVAIVIGLELLVELVELKKK